MGVPWKTTTKDLKLAGDSAHAGPAGHLPPFAPPPLAPSIRTSPSALFAAMAKMQALRGSSIALISALERAAESCTEAIVDDAGSEFDLAPEAESLESTVRSAIAGNVGAGVCHLYMTALGYVWSDFASQLIAAKGPLADFVYEGGPAAGCGVVLAEAKGSFAPGVSAAAMQKRADAAYKKQVAPHVGGATISLSPAAVVHGYAVAFGAQPASIRARHPAAFIHVAQTARVASGTSDEDAGRPDGENDVSASTALGNYRADFMLANAPVVVEAIDRLRRGDPSPVDAVQQFFRLERDGRTFLTGAPSDHPDEWAYGFGSRFGVFAIEESVASAFLDAIREMRSTRFEVPRSILRLDVLPAEMNGIFESNFLFPDGFTLIESDPDDRRPEVYWSQADGLVERYARPQIGYRHTWLEPELAEQW